MGAVEAMVTGLPDASTEEVGVNSISFTLPIPPSVNSLYQIIYSERRVELKPKCRRWKSEAKRQVPRFKVGDTSFITVDVAFAYPYRYRNGNLRVYDASNLLKLLLDAVAEKIGVNDCRFKAGSWSSINSEAEEARVTLTEIATSSSGDGTLTARK